MQAARLKAPITVAAKMPIRASGLLRRRGVDDTGPPEWGGEGLGTSHCCRPMPYPHSPLGYRQVVSLTVVNLGPSVSEHLPGGFRHPSGVQPETGQDRVGFALGDELRGDPEHRHPWL